MSSTTINAGSVAYWRGSSSATSGIIATGNENGGVSYCCYFSLNLSSIPSGAVISNAVISFTRTDSYTSSSEKNYIGIRTSKPTSAFTQTSFNKTLNGGSAFSIATGENELTVSAADLAPYIGQTIYICMCAGESGYCYAELDKTLSKLNITINYQDGVVNWGVNGEWKPCEVYYGANGEWVKCIVYYGDSGEWKQVGGT